MPKVLVGYTFAEGAVVAEARPKARGIGVRARTERGEGTWPLSPLESYTFVWIMNFEDGQAGSGSDLQQPQSVVQPRARALHRRILHQRHPGRWPPVVVAVVEPEKTEKDAFD